MGNVIEKCMKCSTDKNVSAIDILPLKYGSRFDGWGTRVFLCDKCLAESPFNSVIVVEDDELADGSTAVNDDILQYKNEDWMFDYIESLSLESQEKFFNSYAYGEFYTKVKPEAWIAAERMRSNG